MLMPLNTLYVYFKLSLRNKPNVKYTSDGKNKLNRR